MLIMVMVVMFVVDFGGGDGFMMKEEKVVELSVVV